jgi:putative membrane protein
MRVEQRFDCGFGRGFIGTIVMTQFQNAWSKVSKKMKNGAEASAKEENTQAEKEKEDSTMKAAGQIAKLAGRELSHEEKKLGPVVHYSFGTGQGGVYGSVMEMAEEPGGLLPALLWKYFDYPADEITVPALGLSSKATETPLSAHLYGLASHLVYAVSAEMVRRAAGTAMDQSSRRIRSIPADWCVVLA